VTNHWGIEHWMMKEICPQTTGFINLKKFHTKPIIKGQQSMIYKCIKIDTDICLDGWFVSTMPDLNKPVVFKLFNTKCNMRWLNN
jgi:hypothetical protein